MDLFRYVLKSQNGITRPEHLRQQLPYLVYSRVTHEYPRLILSPQNKQCYDFDCCNNWLIASHSGFHVSIYKVRDLTADGNEYIYTWRRSLTEIPSTQRRYALECVNWNSHNSFFTLTGDDASVNLVDTANLELVETIYIPDAREIYQHRPQPFKESILAVASSLHDIPLIDLRSGNISLTASGHMSSVRSIAWSQHEEYLLASACDTQILLWDIRMTQNPFFVPVEPVRSPVIVPELQFVSGKNSFVCLTADRRLHLWNKNNFRRIESGHFVPRVIGPAQQVRYKFSIPQNSTPPIMFMPYHNVINIVNLETMEIMSELSGHMYPVTTTIFNQLKNELYSSARDGNVVWAPQPLFIDSKSP